MSMDINIHHLISVKAEYVKSKSGETHWVELQFVASDGKVQSIHTFYRDGAYAERLAAAINSTPLTSGDAK